MSEALRPTVIFLTACIILTILANFAMESMDQIKEMPHHEDLLDLSFSYQTGCTEDDFSNTKILVSKNAEIGKIFGTAYGPKKPVVVAVIDTGTDMKHPDLANSFWTNPGESGKDAHGASKESNGIDDDGNGFIDDVHGWNFVENNNVLTDHHGHGTHIAGLIRSTSDDGNRPNVQLMILRYFNPEGDEKLNLINTVNAIRYAVKMKAQIINYSGGGIAPSLDEYLAIKESDYVGILFVAAAGNEKANSDRHPFFPADYKLANIISVTAVDSSLRILASSNYGTKSVDIAAQGKNICSTYPNGDHGLMTGTSQAAAIVSGTAALLLAQGPQVLPADLKSLLITTAKQTKWLAETSRSRGTVDIEKAAWLMNFVGKP